MKNSLLAILAIASLSVTSCTKESQEDAAFAISKENTAGTYAITAMTMSSNGSAETSIFESVFEDCQRDDSYTLGADGSYTINDDGTQCGTARVPQVGTWSLSSDAKQITIDGDTHLINSFDGQRLVVVSDFTSNGMSGTVKTTFTRK